MSIVEVGMVVRVEAFQFDIRRMKSRTIAGCPDVRRVSFGMPRIPAEVLKCTFFLYRSRNDAERGINSGGTGFFIGLQSTQHQNISHGFAITNWHVAVRDGFSVIRVNRVGGGVDIIEREPHEWLFKPNWYDLAITESPPSMSAKTHDIRLLDCASNIITAAGVEAFKIGPGEDAFMVGRFIDHDGAETNAVATRFGNISMMPSPIQQANGVVLPSYCLDMHSRTGFSGSPVFSYRTQGSDLTVPPELQMSGLFPRSHYIGLLGVHWGQFPELWEIQQDGNLGQSNSLGDRVGYLIPGKYVKGVSGMSCVCPAWAISDLLQMDEIKSILDDDNREFASKGLRLPPRTET